MTFLHDKASKRSLEKHKSAYLRSKLLNVPFPLDDKNITFTFTRILKICKNFGFIIKRASCIYQILSIIISNRIFIILTYESYPLVLESLIEFISIDYKFLLDKGTSVPISFEHKM